MAKISTSFPHPLIIPRSHEERQRNRPPLQATAPVLQGRLGRTLACYLFPTPSIFCPVPLGSTVTVRRALSLLNVLEFANRRHHRRRIRKTHFFDPTILFAGGWASKWCSELQVLVNPLDSDSRRSIASFKFHLDQSETR